ncbi:MAG TPA: hypothetical protein VMG40_19465 [Bryobacteraceae bacterium]|nr:hypothetical protein [Bryobacteraceae bacterium]
MEDFDPSAYGAEVARVLALDGEGRRLLPLTCDRRCFAAAKQELKKSSAAALFRGAVDSKAAMAGLWLYFSCFEEAHELASSGASAECELWHAILHRQEPDPGNSAYWFRKAGPHPVFSKIAQAAVRILERHPDAEFRIGKWDPFAFIAFCERARMQPGTGQERAALEIQLAEWQILFDYCAVPRGSR